MEHMGGDLKRLLPPGDTVRQAALGIEKCPKRRVGVEPVKVGVRSRGKCESSIDSDLTNTAGESMLHLPL